MSKADKVFKATCKDILENGISSEGENVRPKWPDGTPAHTIKKFGVVNEYDLQEEFPLITLRKTPIKSAVEEMLWIWQKKSNNIHDMNSHVWDEWADAAGTIGKAYGYQQAKKYRYKDVTPAKIDTCAAERGLWTDRFLSGDVDIVFYFDQKTSVTEVENYKKIPGDKEKIKALKEKSAMYYEENAGFYMTQLDRVLYLLKNDPFSRRMIVTMWNPEDAAEMALEPCAYSMTFNVTKAADGYMLNSILNQRSQDILAANAWNVAQYAVLTMMLAQVSGMKPGKFIHVIADAHIYDRHIDAVKELVERPDTAAPKVWLNPEVEDFYDFTKDDVFVEDYEPGGPQIRDIPIAV